jgi:lipoprotein-releasing system permease protein
VWHVLTAAGSGIALTFIVAIAVGVFALTLLYLGSAVIVLEQFARSTRRPLLVGVFGVIAAALATGFALHQRWFESLLGESASPLAVAALATAATAAALALCRTGLRSASASLRSLVVLLLLALAAALWLASTAQPALAAAPAVAIGVVSLLLGLRARASRKSAAAGFARQLAWVAAALFGGSLLAALLPAADPRLAQIGERIIATVFFVIVLGLVPLAAAGLFEARRSAEWFVAIRYLVAKRRQVFISAITAICVGGIAAGVWLIIIVLSVMNGFEQTWREEILGNRAHFTVHRVEGDLDDYQALRDRVREVPGVAGASPYLDAEGMVRGRGGNVFGVRLRGVDPRTLGDVTDLPDDLLLGSFDDLSQEAETRDDEGEEAPSGIVIGNQLAISVGATLGDDLTLISPFGGPPTPLGAAPRLERFRVVGIFQTSFFQYDDVYAYASIPAVQSFRGAGAVVDGIEARTTDFYRSAAVGRAVVAHLGSDFFTRDWKEFFPAFFQALRTERAMMFVLLTMIMVVAAFLIVATLVMMIMEKSSDIAILKAMGAEDRTVERIFAIEGTLIGLAGTAVGMVAGIAVTHQLAWIQARIESVTGVDALPASVYQFSTLPSEVDPSQVAGVALIAMVLCLGATLLPSRQGARIDPAEGLRYE